MVYSYSKREALPVPLIGPQGWLLATMTANPHQYNTSILLETPPDVKPEFLEESVKQLIFHHEALCMRFAYEGATWQQYMLAPHDICPPFTYLDLSTQSHTEQIQTIEVLAEQFQRSLHLSNGPTLHIVLFGLGPSKPDRLLMIIHHIIADEISLPILVNDLLTAYMQLCRGEAVQLEKTGSFKEYADLVAWYLRSETFQQEADYWLQMPWAKVTPLPVDYPEGKKINTIGSTCFASASLTSEETQTFLHFIPKLYRAPYTDVLLTCLVQSFAAWTKNHVLQVSIVYNGRMIPGPFFDKINLLKTVGFLGYGTELLILEIQKNQSLEQQLRSVQQQLHSMPHRGASCQWLRYLSEDEALIQKRQMLPDHEVVFNYHGQIARALFPSSPFQRAYEQIGTGRDPQNPRGALLICQAAIREGQFVATWVYSRHIHRTETIENLAQAYIEHLRLFIKNAMA